MLHERDSVDAHIADTLEAGAGLCHEPAVRFTIEHSREVIDWLISQGLDFDLRQDQPDDEFREFHLTMEGGHSFRRILHSADKTGSAISAVLNQRVAERSNIVVMTDRCAVDLIADEKGVRGIYVLKQPFGIGRGDQSSSGRLSHRRRKQSLSVHEQPRWGYRRWHSLAWRAGCRVANLEFNQFHPTCLYSPETRTYLLTEALRGEGATLHLPSGERFMPRYDHRGELAPRDVVARAIDSEMKRLGLDCVYLDASHQNAEQLKAHFPGVLERCQQVGVDLTKERVPVVPAAHYTCGGVVVDQHSAADLPGLYVIGETACTGLHGANRMASNSLLECFVYARSAALHIVDNLRVADASSVAPWDDSKVRLSDEAVVIQHNWQSLRRLMWDYVGIVRSNRRLKRAANRLKIMSEEVNDYYSSFTITPPLLELRNLTQVSELMVTCARQRKESRGLHYNSDFPDPLQRASDTVLVPTNAWIREETLPGYKR